MENSELSRVDMQVKAAHLYYTEGCSQEKIASMLHVSRPTVSRILKSCVEEGIVTIRIADTSSQLLELSEKLQIKFGLRKVIVAPSVDGNPSGAKDRAGEEAAAYVQTLLGKASLVGISWGSSVSAVLQHIEPQNLHQTDTIQLLGDAALVTRETTASYMTLNFSKTLGGAAYIMQMPMMVRSRELHDMLMEEPALRAHFARMGEADVAIVGCSSIYSPYANDRTVNLISQAEYESLEKLGAVCNLCGTFLDINGKKCPTPLHDRTFAVPLETLRTIPEVIGVAVGIQKRDQLCSVLRGGYLTTLVTDRDAAVSLLGV